ncbi:MAG TPA: matrixin family metalloprotease [Polyangiaceae bacterium]|nr:matrixin family metalloprotease [Polyangiaceae bacterium]
MNERSLLRPFWSTLIFTLGLLAPRAASAYCRATTCDPRVGDVCNRDAGGCVTGYPPLYWPGSCVTFAVQRDGSALNRITGAAMEVAVHRAFETWMSADCGNGRHPGIHVETLGLIECDQVEFNAQRANANDFMFRDRDWSVDSAAGDALGLTTAHFDSRSGQIQDADVEINGSDGNLTNADVDDGADLLSILTHESGHFLGLDHSRDVNSVMYPNYRPGMSDLRHLSADDSAGICAIYPPSLPQTSAECRPWNGFSGVCANEQREPLGCSFAPNATLRAGATKRARFCLGLLVALALVLAKRRPRARSTGPDSKVEFSRGGARRCALLARS